MTRSHNWQMYVNSVMLTGLPAKNQTLINLASATKVSKVRRNKMKKYKKGRHADEHVPTSTYHSVETQSCQVTPGDRSDRASTCGRARMFPAIHCNRSKRESTSAQSDGLIRKKISGLMQQTTRYNRALPQHMKMKSAITTHNLAKLWVDVCKLGPCL